MGAKDEARRFAVEVRTGDVAALRSAAPCASPRAAYQPRVAIGADGTRAVQWLEDAPAARG